MARLNVLVHLFVPHHSNNHRSKALHIDSLLIYVLVFSLFNLGFRMLHRSMPDVLGYATDIHVEQLLQETNTIRQAKGLPVLTVNQQLSQAAGKKAQDMFAKGYWAHNSPDGATPWDFIAGSGYRYVVAGENLAKNFSTSQSVVQAWMESPTHRDNILKSSYREIGFAVVDGVLNGEETTLVVQMFGSSQSSLAQAPTPPPAPPVEVDQKAVTVAAHESEVQAPPAASAFLGVTRRPLINIPSITRDFVFIFAGVLLGVLAIDAWIVSRRGIVRVAGHNLAHMLFLSTILIAVSTVTRGSLV